ncbi:uncharacterized protein FOMMEDRAFT_160698 [Fomitiporia mediterranea MF3/22]|uniref:uncharacterized protein n=1 Tax=Fomitiporia mediterranea (strain MF3/22) TaxID=694068 RepID=UPI000440883C|nr:uncharacterized protein FOMMEDRAFT_160698 [Fomitiporia mediterranea MF3/22]EJC99132.1 hypothetical protein FOMMEDRAFT_160698 [Fomitiporia mediterranea MF3/22]
MRVDVCGGHKCIKCGRFNESSLDQNFQKQTRSSIADVIRDAAQTTRQQTRQKLVCLRQVLTSLTENQLTLEAARVHPQEFAAIINPLPYDPTDKYFCVDVLPFATNLRNPTLDTVLELIHELCALATSTHVFSDAPSSTSSLMSRRRFKLFVHTSDRHCRNRGVHAEVGVWSSSDLLRSCREYGWFNLLRFTR